MATDTVCLDVEPPEPDLFQVAHSNSEKAHKRRLAPAPPDARWDPTALPSDEDDDEPRWTELQLAARGGDPDRVKAILARYPGAEERARIVNAPPQGWYGQTALQAACMHEHDEAVRILLDAGADIGAPGGNNIYRNAFEYACGTGNVRLVRVLLAAGATRHINRERVTRYQGRTPIQAAAESGSRELVDVLLDLGADINAPPSPFAGLTTLQAACLAGHVDLVRHLLAEHADVNAAAAKHGGMTALQAACRAGEHEVVETLLAAGAEMNIGGDVHGDGLALHAAAEGGHGGVVRMLLTAGADVNVLAGRAGLRGQTALQCVYLQGHADVVEILIESGATGPLIGGKRLFGHVAARSWSSDAMAIGGADDERGRISSASRQRAPSPNPMARRTRYHEVMP